MIEHKINQENLFVRGWYIDENVCNSIVNTFNSNPHLHYDGVLGYPAKVIKEKKDSIDCDFYHEQFNQKQDYFSQLQNCVDHYIETFKWCNECDPWNIAERVNVQYYPPGAGYHQWHSERGTQIYPNCTRHLVFMTYLNDVTDGGETEFFYQNIKIKPEKGLTLIWPVDWTYTHRGVVSPSQEKYIITGWFNFVEKL